MPKLKSLDSPSEQPSNNPPDSLHFTHDLSLHSRGKMNPEIPGGIIKIQHMTTHEEAMLAGGGKDGSALDQVIASLIKTPGVSVDNLVVQDYYQVLIAIRVLTFGSEYSFDFRCPECDIKSRQTMDLTKDLDESDIKDANVEPYEIGPLPVIGKKLLLRYLRRGDLKSIRDYGKRKRKDGDTKGDPSYPYRLAKHIVEIVDFPDGTNPARILDFCENMHSRDSSYLKRSLSDRDFGISTDIKMVCPDCKEELEEKLPISSDFFLPG